MHVVCFSQYKNTYSLMEDGFIAKATQLEKERFPLENSLAFT
jgi:hypothetical protein